MIIVADYSVLFVGRDGKVHAVVQDGAPVQVNGLVQTQNDIIEWCFNPY